MTLGVGYAERSDLASQMSAAEDIQVAQANSSIINAHPSLEITSGFDPSDGANYSGGSSYSPSMPLMPSSAGLAGLAGMEQGIPPNVEQGIKKWHKYLHSLGTPWPTPFKPYGLEPTVESYRSSIYEGWNAASQPGAPPGFGFAEADFGGMTYMEAMEWTPAPLTQALGALGALAPHQEQAFDLRPGFGAVEERQGGVVLPMLMMAGVAVWIFTR